MCIQLIKRKSLLQQLATDGQQFSPVGLRSLGLLVLAQPWKNFWHEEKISREITYPPPAGGLCINYFCKPARGVTLLQTSEHGRCPRESAIAKSARFCKEMKVIRIDGMLS